MATISRCQN
jgi:putative transposase